MKRLLILIWAICVVINASAQDEGVKFETGTLSDAIKKAGKTKKQVFVDCYTSWCGPCKYMAEKIFTQKKVGDFFNENFVNIKIDMGNGEGRELAKKFSVTVYPTFLILSHSGIEVNRLVGGNKADVFIEKVRVAMNPAHTPQLLQAKYESEQTVEAGLAYLACLDNAYRDVKPLLPELYWQAVREDKLSRELLTLVFKSTEALSDSIFQHVCRNTNLLSQQFGQSFIHENICAALTAPLYAIAVERVTKYDRREVENAARIMGMLDISSLLPMKHLAEIVLYMISHDTDGMISFYEKVISRTVQSDDKYKMDRLLARVAKPATEDQKKNIKAYFEHTAKSLRFTGLDYSKLAENIE